MRHLARARADVLRVEHHLYGVDHVDAGDHLDIGVERTQGGRHYLAETLFDFVVERLVRSACCFLVVRPPVVVGRYVFTGFAPVVFRKRVDTPVQVGVACRATAVIFRIREAAPAAVIRRIGGVLVLEYPVHASLVEALAVSAAVGGHDERHAGVEVPFAADLLERAVERLVGEVLAPVRAVERVAVGLEHGRSRSIEMVSHIHDILGHCIREFVFQVEGQVSVLRERRAEVGVCGAHLCVVLGIDDRRSLGCRPRRAVEGVDCILFLCYRPGLAEGCGS